MSNTHTLDASAVAPRFPRTIVRYLPAIARILMGALFLFAGSFGLFARPQMPPGLPEAAVAFNAALVKSGYMLPMIAATEAFVGVLLLANRFVPLALALLAPVVVNILAFHVFLEPSGRPIAVIVVALEVYLAWQYRDAYRPMLSPRAARTTGSSPAPTIGGTETRAAA